MNNLGEVFYNGRIISLNNTENGELKKIFENLESIQAYKKEKITNCLRKMRNQI